MNHTKRIASLVLCVMILLFATVTVSAKTVFPVGSWVYEKINNETEFEIDEYVGTSTDVYTLLHHNKIPITSVGEYAFESNAYVKTINMRAPMNAIQNFAFTDCSALTTVVLNEGIKHIGAGGFMGCVSLTSINLQDTVIPAVNSSTFMNCDSLKEVTLPDTVKSIDAYAFSSCDNLAKITIPASVTSIDEDAFKDSDNVVIYCYSNSTAHTYAVSNSIDFVLLDQQATEPTQPTIPENSYVLGDSDEDGSVSVLDATTIQRLLASLIADDDGKIAVRGNVDQDELLSIMDATLIQRYIASYNDGLSIGQIFEY